MYIHVYICMLLLQYIWSIIWISSGLSRFVVLTPGPTSEYPTFSVCVYVRVWNNVFCISFLSFGRCVFVCYAPCTLEGAFFTLVLLLLLWVPAPTRGTVTHISMPQSQIIELSAENKMLPRLYEL